MRKRLYQMQSGPSPVSLFDTTRTPYPPKMGMLSYVMEVKSTLDVIGEMEVTQPMAPLYTEPLESMPARWDFTPHDHGDKGKWRARWDAAIKAQEDAIFNILVLTEVPDTTPIFVGKLIDGIGNWSNPRSAEFSKALRDARTTAASKAMEPEGLLNNNAAGYANPWAGYPVTVFYLMTEIRRHMLEVNDGVESWQLWQNVEVLHYVRERIARFLVETGLVQDIDTLMSVINEESYDLPTTTAEVKRVAYDGIGLYPLDFWKTDYSGIWSAAAGTPYGYMENVEQLSLQLCPPPSTARNSITVHSVKSTPFTVNDSVDPNAGLSDQELIMTYYLRLPAIFCWAVKYGVMADMLKKEGEANDPQRAEWCEQRFRDGIEIGKLLVGYPVGGGQR